MADTEVELPDPSDPQFQLIEKLTKMTPEERVGALGSEKAAKRYEKILEESRVEAAKVQANIPADPFGAVQITDADNFASKRAKMFLQRVLETSLRGAELSPEGMQSIETTAKVLNDVIPTATNMAVFGLFSNLMGAGFASLNAAERARKAAQAGAALKKADTLRGGSASVAAAGDAATAARLSAQAERLAPVAEKTLRATEIGGKAATAAGEAAGGLVGLNMVSGGDFTGEQATAEMMLGGAGPLMGEAIRGARRVPSLIPATARAAAQATSLAAKPARTVIEYIGEFAFPDELLARALGAGAVDAPGMTVVRPLNASDKFRHTLSDAYGVLRDNNIFSRRYKDFRVKQIKTGKPGSFTPSGTEQMIPGDPKDLVANLRYRVQELAGSDPRTPTERFSKVTNLEVGGEIGEVVKNLDAKGQKIELREVWDELEQNYRAFYLDTSQNADAIKYGRPVFRDQQKQFLRLGLSQEQFEKYSQLEKKIFSDIQPIQNSAKYDANINPFSREGRETIEDFFSEEIKDKAGNVTGTKLSSRGQQVLDRIDLAETLKEKALSKELKPSQLYKKRMLLDVNYTPDVGDGAHHRFEANNYVSDIVRDFNERRFLEIDAALGDQFRTKKEEFHALMSMAQPILQYAGDASGDIKLPWRLSFGLGATAAGMVSKAARGSGFQAFRHNVGVLKKHTADGTYLGSFISQIRGVGQAAAATPLGSQTLEAMEPVINSVSSFYDKTGGVVYNGKKVLSTADSGLDFLTAVAAKVADSQMGQLVKTGMQAEVAQQTALSNALTAIEPLQQAIENRDQEEIAVQLLMLQRLTGGKVVSPGKTGYEDMEIEGKSRVMDPEKQLTIVRKTGEIKNPNVAGKILNGIQKGGIVDDLPAELHRK